MPVSLISPELLSVLRCPVTGSELVQDGEELVAVTPDAGGRTLRYTIEDGIPLLLPPELLAAATAAPSDQHDAAVPNAAAQDAAAQDTAAQDAVAQETAQQQAGQAPSGPRHAAE